MLSINGLRHQYGDSEVLHGLSLDVAQGEILSLLGPSGCGKTTLLRIVAGLERLQSGALTLDGESLTGVPVHQRHLGLMFQDFALFPHMSVAENVAFGLRMQGIAQPEREARVAEVLSLVGLDDYAARDVAQLSGGERQRVALARSLAPKPRLLMLDEPLGSLDAALRDHLVTELRAIIQQAGLTALYVTHDQAEAFAIADRVAVMNAGHIEALDTPQRLYQYPRTAFTARFLNLDNVVPVVSQQDTAVRTPLGRFTLANRPDSRVKSVLLHPDGLHLVPETEPGIPGQVVASVFGGDHYRLRVHVAGGMTLSLKRPAAQTPVEVGQAVRLRVLTDYVLFLLD